MLQVVAGTLNFDVSGAKSSFTPSTSNPVHVYMLFSNDYTNNNSTKIRQEPGVKLLLIMKF